MKKAFLVAGLLFGDEGKGATIDYLTRQYGASLIIRYNGGPQNAHNVVTPDGRHHTFSQIGSGSFVPGVHTHISKYTLFDPLSFMNEMAQFPNMKWSWSQLSVDEDAVIVTPFHRTLNRLAEAFRGREAHGSVGMGLGVARRDSLLHPNEILRAKHLTNIDETMKRLKFIEELHTKEAHSLFKAIHQDQSLGPDILWFDGGNGRDFLWTEYLRIPRFLTNRSLDQITLLHDTLIFEGGQGFYLDQDYGFQPHTTWTDTTLRNANTILNGLDTKVETHHVGCIRPYATRHGKGPLPYETSMLSLSMPEYHNKSSRWQGSFRHGFLDLTMIAQAAEKTGGIDSISISCMDRLCELFEPLTIVHRGQIIKFENPGDPEVQELIITVIEDRLQTPITLVGNGPSSKDRFERRPFPQSRKVA